MRRLRSTKAFRVEVAPAVWRELGLVPGDHFKRMQAELENVAQLVALSGTPRPQQPLRAVRVDDYEGIYEVDPERQLVRLVSVFRSPGKR